MALRFVGLALLFGLSAACKIGTASWSGVTEVKFTAQQILDGRASDTYNWAYSPCEAAVMCSNAGNIQQQSSDGKCHAYWDVLKNSDSSNTQSVITYDGKGEGWTTTATVTVACDATVGAKVVDANGGKVTVTTVSPTQFAFQFQFKSGCACGKGCSGGGGAGWIFVGIVLGGFFLYFVVGFIFNVKKRELKGAQAIPHVEFWKDLPFLTKDGCLFVFGRFCRNSSYSPVK